MHVCVADCVAHACRAVGEGKPFQHSVIIARNDSPVNSIGDLKGRSFAFGDIHSTCNDWTTAIVGYQGIVGSTAKTNDDWIYNGKQDCMDNAKHHLHLTIWIN